MGSVEYIEDRGRGPVSSRACSEVGEPGACSEYTEDEGRIPVSPREYSEVGDSGACSEYTEDEGRIPVSPREYSEVGDSGACSEYTEDEGRIPVSPREYSEVGDSGACSEYTEVGDSARGTAVGGWGACLGFVNASGGGAGARRGFMNSPSSAPGCKGDWYSYRSRPWEDPKTPSAPPRLPYGPSPARPLGSLSGIVNSSGGIPLTRET
ncbi:hypothetical protein GCM10009863_21170 [Streptomyces axinellae]|uniref:Uncharacterized protein n=1 Tax=Streptomyces axinellae TaxID=552788 RepID=A0ABN3Q1J1_9ACTN